MSVTVRFSGLAAGLIVACGSVSSCGGGPPGSSPLKIGAVLSLSGAAADVGKSERNAANLAVEQINLRGGINGHLLQIEFGDDQTNPDQTVQSAESLLGKNVLGLIGPTTAPACRALISKTKIETSGPIDYCLAPGIKPKSNSYVWTAAAPDDIYAGAITSYIKVQGFSQIGLLTTTDVDGVDGRDAIRSAMSGEGGIQIAADVVYSPTATDAAAQLQQIKGSAAQAIVLWSSGSPAVVALRGIQQLGLNLPVITTGANASYDFIKRINNVTPTSLVMPATAEFWLDQNSPDAALYSFQTTFRNEFKSKYGLVPDSGPGAAYDATMLLADVLRCAGQNPAQMKDQLQSLQGFVGVQGRYTYTSDDHSGLSDYVSMVLVVNGAFIQAGPGPRIPPKTPPPVIPTTCAKQS